MIFRNNPDFYPTPAAVIDRMLMDDSPSGLVVLEPSAGSGNIVRKLNEYGAAEVLACETDENLRRVLQGEKCQLIGTDFLNVTAEQISHVNMIVMNPPFSQGARHLLHAYEIAPAGCVIISLINSSNLENLYSRQRGQLSELVANYGYSEKLGAVFAEDAERATRCSVTLVKIWKEGRGEHEFDGYFSAIDTDEQSAGQHAGLMRYSFLQEIVSRYVEAVKMFDSVQEATERINRAAQFVSYTVTTDPETGEQRAKKHTYGLPPVMFRPVITSETNHSDNTTAITHQTYKRQLQKYYWRIIFDKMDLDRFATRELRQQINRYIEQRQSTPFTVSNIYRVIDTIIKTTGQRMQRALCEAFDTICSLSAENSTAGETWKTNSNYMVNRRFIKSGVCQGYHYCSRDSYPSVNLDCLRNTGDIDDVTKALCYMTGRDYNEIQPLYKTVYDKKPEWGQWFEWGFFRCRGYKKGTMHFEFIDEKVWQRFNQEVADSRGWIGSTTHTAHGAKTNRKRK